MYGEHKYGESRIYLVCYCIGFCILWPKWYHEIMNIPHWQWFVCILNSFAHTVAYTSRYPHRNTNHLNAISFSEQMGEVSTLAPKADIVAASKCYYIKVLCAINGNIHTERIILPNQYERIHFSEIVYKWFALWVIFSSKYKNKASQNTRSEHRTST